MYQPHLNIVIPPFRPDERLQASFIGAHCVYGPRAPTGGGWDSANYRQA